MNAQDTRTSFDIKLGNRVFCGDAPAGHVTGLVVEPVSRRVTSLVVMHGLLRHELVVPIQHVTRTADEMLVLDLSIDELAALPRYGDLDYALPTADWSVVPYAGVVFDPRRHTAAGVPMGALDERAVSMHGHRGVPADEIPIDKGTRITGDTGRMGRLDHVLLDPQSDSIQALVVHRGHRRGRDLLIAVDRIDTIDEDAIYIHTGETRPDELPPYRPMLAEM